jgi:signal transduction histidine kinase
MLPEFLKENKNEILEAARLESLSLAGVRATSDQLRLGLPVFFQHLVHILDYEKLKSPAAISVKPDAIAREKAATESNEVAMAMASGHPEDIELAKSSGLLGVELLRLGYTLSHVVHIYGSLCQAITGLAVKKSINISALEFRNFNRCLDVAIAGAVTEFQRLRELQKRAEEVKRCGFCAHELRNSLGSALMSFELIKSGEVGFSGSVGQILGQSLKRMEALIGRTLTEVKLSGVRPSLEIQDINLLLLVDQLLVTANIEAKSRRQTIEVQISSDLTIKADLQFFHSAVSNLLQNALKYTHDGGKIQIRAKAVNKDVIFEVEDECGGLPENAPENLFKPFEQQNENRKGLGLGLSLARRAIELHNGTLVVRDLPGTGCVFTIQLPRDFNPNASAKKDH